MYTPQRDTGTFTGTGSAVKIELGYRPDYVKVINVSSHKSLEYIAGKLVEIADTGAQTNPSSGISVDERGFTVDASFVANGNECAYIAIG